MEMSKVQVLRALVKQRLSAAAEEIFGLFERTISEYEQELCRSKEENQRHRKLLDAVFQPEVRLHRAVSPADVQQLSGSKEEVPPEQQEWSLSLDQEDPEPPHVKEKWSLSLDQEDPEPPHVKEKWSLSLDQEDPEPPHVKEKWSLSLDQEDPEPPHVKEEQEDLWTSQEEEQLPGLEDADITKFLFTLLPVKSEEDDEEEPQSSQLHQSQTEQMETEAEGEDCGGPEPARDSAPDRLLQPETEDRTLRVPVSDVRCTMKKPLSCSECGKGFRHMPNLKMHMRTHTGEKPFTCSVCGRGFSQKANLSRHMTRHTGEKPFSCSVCKKRFRYRGDVGRHMKIHTREKLLLSEIHQESEPDKTEDGYGGREKTRGPRSGLNPNKVPIHVRPSTDKKPTTRFSQKGDLLTRSRIHTGEKTFSRRICEKSFTQNLHLTKHMAVCSEECSTWDHQLRTPRCVGPQSSQLHQNQTEQIDADGEDCGGPELARDSDPDRLLQPETADSGVEVSDGWKEPRGLQSGLNSLRSNGVSDSTAEKPRSCSVCGKGFSRKYSLKIHMRIHTGEKPFSCSICGKHFNQRFHFVEHMRRHTGEDTFDCSLCGKKFGYNFRLKNHMRTHTGEKPFGCSLCGKRFAQKGSLRQHMLLHT
ncbi:gastrula zinc finger protein XlCGF26.1-like [Micropterus salmoides]|uniref:gastrula zinc finger protein XlCGF26.1-like n=1 Tax=Micropterus salmoides TaxID=27706 RepID=UPI0018ED449D|nr:gastrula zinc finger protein XlCGF26.1-like [Micropterus salmoides]